MKTYGEWIECVSTDPQFRVFLRFDLKTRRKWTEQIDVDLLALAEPAWLPRHLDNVWRKEFPK